VKALNAISQSEVDYRQNAYNRDNLVTRRSYVRVNNSFDAAVLLHRCCSETLLYCVARHRTPDSAEN